MSPRQALRSVLATLGLGSCAALSTADQDLSANVGFSALPNIGVTAGVAQAFDADESRIDSFELQGTFQPLDDEDLHDDGHPHSGDFTQIQLGVKRAWRNDATRFWTGRAGAVWFRADGEPNIVQEEGDYIGLYASAGFETRFTEHLSMGPDLTLMLVTLESSGEVDVVPQLMWRVSWGF